ncbi:alpha/beta fold hydrolase [Nocardia rhamnosiphila]
MPFVYAPDGVALHYTSTGEGPALVLVHGWTMNGQFFHKNIAALSARHRVVTIDCRGHGKSGKDLVNLTMEQLADDLESVLEALEIDRAVLAGWSMGMSTVYTYVSRHGLSRVAGLASIDMTARVLNAPDWGHGVYGELTAEGSLDIQRTMIADRPALSAALIPAMFAAGSTPDAEDIEWWVDQSTNVPNLTALALWVSFSSQDWRNLIAQIDVPILFMHGQRSQLYPTPLWESMAEIAKDGRIALFDTGHAPFWESPDEFNASLLDFCGELQE